jgi:hypothetical protein
VKKKLLLCMALCLIGLGVQAQLIDLDFPNKTNVTEANYTPWVINAGTSGQITLSNGVSISVTNGSASTANG